MKKISLADMDFDDAPESKQDNLLTNTSDSPSGKEKKPRPSSIIMMGVRVTKGERREYKALANSLDMSLETLVRTALKHYKSTIGLR